MQNLIWKNNTPVSPQYDDVYFSAHDGLAETQHVFLRGNNLPERFATQNATQAGFTICELGFGIGLNFLAAVQLWQQQAGAGTLKFISCDKYPLGVADMKDVFANVRERLPNIEDFLRKWENLHAWAGCEGLISEGRLKEGWYHIKFDQGTHQGVRKGGLHLYVGDVRDMFSSMESASSCSGVNAWFLDGFAPAKNPEMWHSDIYEAMARHSRAGATLATYTAAGHVRRGLAQAGFNVWKEKGFGTKRDMTTGRLYANLNFQK